MNEISLSLLSSSLSVQTKHEVRFSQDDSLERFYKVRGRESIDIKVESKENNVRYVF